MSLLDFLKCRYIYHAARNHVLPTSIYASCSTLVSGMVVLSYIHDIRMIIPAAFGTLLGTSISLKLNKNVL